jgi:hypothetical protein
MQNMSKHQNKSFHVPEEPSLFLDTNLPNMARIFDYLGGGSAHFESDREAAAQMIVLIPSLKKWVRLRRAFIQEAVLQLTSEGFFQYLDLGSGMPSDDQIHQFTPTSRVIYSDINPVAVSYGNSLFNDLPLVDYILGDAIDVEAIFNHSVVKKVINLEDKVAIGLNALLLFLSPEYNKQLAQALYQWAPEGSKLFLVFQTRADIELPERYEQFVELTKKAGLPLHIYPLDHYIDVLQPWQIDEVTPLTQYLGLPEDFISKDDQEGIGMMFYAAFLIK